MSLISIDFSINSTALCIQHKDGLEWFNFVSNYNPSRKAFSVHKELSESSSNVHIIGYERDKPKDLPYSEEQSWKINNANHLSYIILNAIAPYVDEESVFAFEGYSYGSKGNSFIDLITYNTFLKSKIVRICQNDIRVLAPKSVKKDFTDNGNAGKPMMMNSFISRKDDLLKNDAVHNYCCSVGDFGEKVPKPLDDMVDAFAILKYLEQQL